MAHSDDSSNEGSGQVLSQAERAAQKLSSEHSRAFTVVMNKVRERLRDIFGMDLVELPAKEKKAITSSGTTRRGGANKDKSSSKSYALQNILPQKLRDTDQLRHYFRTLYLENNPKFESDKLLANFVKQGYLDKQKSGFADNSSQAPEREHVEYRWGPRAKIEMPEANLCDFIKSVYGDDAPPDIIKQIERASGIDTNTAT
ncbi:8404_t:CDS:2 [Racocetra fulgida]|uniref:8404_t:CDS:1 n=1 Tax=Racocetra fulgida TaxID=60492 RepID=A0A9N8WPS7_9GLOM|nr:8404_t:CDS:2 [Racocetra fulgida]